MRTKALAAAMLLTLASTAHAQAVLSERREAVPVTVTPITTSDAQRETPGMRAFVTGGANIPDSTTSMQESTVQVLVFQIPDFNPEDLYSHRYHVGMFSDNGNGSGTAFPNDDGYVEFEHRTFKGENPMETFLYSVQVDTGEVRVFIDVDNVSVNTAAGVLTNLALNSRAELGQRTVGDRRPPRMIMPPPEAYTRKVRWSGDYLTLDELQEEIYAQTRCDVAQSEADDFRFYVLGCD